jgi:hypothetical protein
MFPQMPAWIGYIFPAYHVIRPVTKLTVIGASYGPVALYAGILIAIVIVMGLAVMNI